MQVDCPERLLVSHDRKWTTEALFNILDNAVKYTPEGGDIRVSVECWEMYVKIDITDNGIGISGGRREQSSNGFTGRIRYTMRKESGLDCILPVRLFPFREGTLWWLLSREKVLRFRCVS